MLLYVWFSSYGFPDWSKLGTALGGIDISNREQAIAQITAFARSYAAAIVDAIAFVFLAFMTLYAWYDWVFQHNPINQSTYLRSPAYGDAVRVAQLEAEKAVLVVANARLEGERASLQQVIANLQAQLASLGAIPAMSPSPSASWQPFAGQPQVRMEGHAQYIPCHTVNFNFYEGEDHGRPAVEIENV